MDSRGVKKDERRFNEICTGRHVVEVWFMSHSWFIRIFPLLLVVEAQWRIVRRTMEPVWAREKSDREPRGLRYHLHGLDCAGSDEAAAICHSWTPSAPTLPVRLDGYLIYRSRVWSVGTKMRKTRIIEMKAKPLQRWTRPLARGRERTRTKERL